jgi:hypothetical protein
LERSHESSGVPDCTGMRRRHSLRKRTTPRLSQ